MEIFLIDAIGPFFRDYQKQRINWSKIPFHHLHLEGDRRRAQFDRIRRDMDLFAGRVSAAGFTAVSLDDVAHLAADPWHDRRTNEEIATFAAEYERLFTIIRGHGLDVYLTMDVLSFTPALKERIKGRIGHGLAFMKRQLETVFAAFPDVRGIIFRIGECDGRDVKGTFKSELFLRDAAAVNRMVRELLPLFERHQRLMILRTWTIGAYRIGDFIWHRRTTARVLRGINSANFILSMKYGESDFFRYLPLNKHFFKFKVRKIVELQARREYEGCGEYPSFVGWDYERYARQLDAAEQMAGISVWCQTGGWVPFRRLTYLEEEGLWNELNCYVTLKLFRERWPVERAVRSFVEERGTAAGGAFVEFLRLDDEVIKELLYIKEVAEQKLFFRRVRIPPLLTVYWNNVFINHSARAILLALVTDREACIEQGFAALKKIERMTEIAAELDLPTDDIRFMEDTFRLLALSRCYYFQEDTDQARQRLKKAKKHYKKRYPKDVRPRYRIKTNYRPFPIGFRQLSVLLRIALRTKRGYRIVDYLITIHLLAALYRLLVLVRPKSIPKFARKHAMGIETIFR